MILKYEQFLLESATKPKDAIDCLMKFFGFQDWDRFQIKKEPENKFQVSMPLERRSFDKDQFCKEMKKKYNLSCNFWSMPSLFTLTVGFSETT